MMIPIDRRAIEAILRVGSYEKPLTGEDEQGRGWQAAAKKLVAELGVWVAVNRERLGGER